MYIDRVLGTRPVFTISPAGCSFPASLYIIYRVALRSVADDSCRRPRTRPRQAARRIALVQSHRRPPTRAGSGFKRWIVIALIILGGYLAFGGRRHLQARQPGRGAAR